MNTIWSTNGTGSRIFGDAVAAEATNTKTNNNNASAANAWGVQAKRTNQEKLDAIRERRQQQQGMSNKQRQRLKKAEKKLRNEVRRKDEADERPATPDDGPIVADVQALSI